MNQNEEIKQLKIELENFKKEMAVWSAYVATTLQNMYPAISNQILTLFNIVIKIDKQNRIDTDQALKNISNNQQFSLHQSKIQNNKFNSDLDSLKESLALFQKNDDIGLIFHNAKYNELELFLQGNEPKNKIQAKDIDDILADKYGVKKNKIRIKDNKEIKMTLPIYIRHHFHHINEGINEKPSNKEINESICIILNILNKIDNPKQKKEN